MTTDEIMKRDTETGFNPAALAGKGEDITPKQDRGVLKIIKRQGLSSETPMTGDKVSVHYIGKLANGKTFDSSRDRNEYFFFSLGKGQVIRAWDIGVASMVRGEVCVLQCRPEYAYGAAGSVPKIPPNATLFFEIELLDFKGEDLSADGGIIRRIKQRGEGYSSPNEGSRVEIHLEGLCGDHVFDSRDVAFIVGEGEDYNIPIGIDKALEKMQRGECSLLHLSPRYAFGEEGKACFNIGPNTHLTYEVTLINFEKAKESWEMDTREKLQQAAVVKEKGTSYFKSGKYLQAVIQYGKIVSWLEVEYGLSEDESQKAKRFLLAAYLNLAMCFIRLQEYGKASENCEKALALDPLNEKGLYRRGEARLLMNEFELAQTDFQSVLEVNPQNKAAKAQVLVCQRKARAHYNRDRRLYANMFQKFAERDTKEEEEESQKSEAKDSGNPPKEGSTDPLQEAEGDV
ncbi:peptidyl-prolyl cis-trans isomerase FKBP5 [Bombina bombina]|uniref:peptidyl-prolyl cis-trans isomerase FKBP5 n=1 Tax=Bombina bombina TaxID=8345 RepID=UPI00235B2517|nr:peptidyl-prolyl cis-trans isomerase FKBP5 [Bombina bombina]